MVIRHAPASYQQQGFTYLLLIVAITLLAIGLAAIGTLTSAAVRHSKQQELLWVGRQYVNAIGDYYQSSPGAVSVYPPTLADLIEDKRYLSIRRHLRELYPDPATDQFDWKPIAAPDGGVMGIESPDSGTVSALRFVYTPPSALASGSR